MRLWRKKYIPIDKILDPAHGGLRDVSDEDLATYKAGWQVGSKNWLLADMEFQRRLAWTTPVKLSLGMSGLAILVSIAALCD